jgi:hypothetical protein
VVSFTHRLLYLRGKSPRIGGWVDLRAGLDNVETRKFVPPWDSKSDPSAVHRVLVL